MWCRRGRWPCSRGWRKFTAASSGALPSCAGARLKPGERNKATSTRSCATTASTSGDRSAAAPAELVDIPSVSHDEGDHRRHRGRAPIVAVVDGRPAREQRGRSHVLGRSSPTAHPGRPHRHGAGQRQRGARIDGDVLWGLGSADMKSGVTMLLELATTMAEPAVDVTYVFYECEEVESRYNGLVKLLAERPDLLAGDAAVLAEPTGARIEAGCQGTLHLKITLHGAGPTPPGRGWAATPSTGLGRLLDRVAAFDERRPVIDGCEFREGLQAVKVEGGVAGNVVPDRAVVWLNHRFAPDRTAKRHRRPCSTCWVTQSTSPPATPSSWCRLAAPAPPALDHPLLQGHRHSVGSRPAGQAGLDRRVVLRRPRRARHQLRARRPQPWPTRPTSGWRGDLDAALVASGLSGAALADSGPTTPQSQRNGALLDACRASIWRYPESGPLPLGRRPRPTAWPPSAASSRRPRLSSAPPSTARSSRRPRSTPTSGRGPTAPSACSAASTTPPPARRDGDRHPQLVQLVELPVDGDEPGPQPDVRA